MIVMPDLAGLVRPVFAQNAFPLARQDTARKRPLPNLIPFPKRPVAPIATMGGLTLHLARGAGDLWAAQHLRYKVFNKEMSAKPTMGGRLLRRDMDRFDRACDHLIVRDTALTGAAAVVGTYRLLGQEEARRIGGFYTQQEFDVDALIARHPASRFLELGRSCVLAPYRTKRTVELLWQGIYSYLQQNGHDVMIGCASFPTTDVSLLAQPLSYLHHFAAAAPAWRASAHPARRVAMDILPKDQVDMKEAFRALPPLVKGYLRLGAMVGDGAVVDRQFGTTDVLIVLPLSVVDARYLNHFGKAA